METTIRLTYCVVPDGVGYGGRSSNVLAKLGLNVSPPSSKIRPNLRLGCVRLFLLLSDYQRKEQCTGLTFHSLRKKKKKLNALKTHL